MIQSKRDRRIAIDWCVKIRIPGRKPLRIGFTWDSLGPAECSYMLRLVLWLEPLFCIRLHKIMRSDNDTHLHDHPWWFITFPFGTYKEHLDNPDKVCATQPRFIINTVKGFRFHFRPAKYRHAVIVDRPTWTFVITGSRMRDWGFWVKDTFVKWTAYDRMFGQTARPCSDPTEKTR